jgi:hypothetical protein
VALGASAAAWSLADRWSDVSDVPAVVVVLDLAICSIYRRVLTGHSDHLKFDMIIDSLEVNPGYPSPVKKE